jgi:raffinose/stachyose/melibiose transport system substrate-binding protein
MGVAASVAVAGLAACGSDGGGDEGGEEGGTFTIAQYEAPATPQHKAWEAAVEQFQEDHPDVKVEFVDINGDSINVQGKLLLTGNDVPDVVEVNTGNASIGQLAAQGLVENLTEQAEARGWADKIPSSLSALARYDELGKAGGGDWFGVPNTGIYFLMYYNRAMFEDAGIAEPPTTLDELEDVFDTFLAAGQVPVSSNGEFGLLQLWGQLVAAEGDRELADSYHFFDSDLTFKGSAFERGTERLVEWIQKGYLGDNLAAITQEQMQTAFSSGEYPMMANGSWYYSLAEQNASFDWGTFAFPEAQLTEGASGHLWAVPVNSDNKELAYDWIDLTLGEGVQNQIAEQGELAIAADPSAIQDEKLREFASDFDDIVQGDSLMLFPDYPVPGLLQFLQSELQSFANGSTDVDGFLDSFQSFYDDGKEQVLNG